MQSVRGGTEFLSDYLMPSPMPDNKRKYNGIWPDFGRSRARFLLLFGACGWRSLFLFPWRFSHPREPNRIGFPAVT
jgi:hypothetical protein